MRMGFRGTLYALAGLALASQAAVAGVEKSWQMDGDIVEMTGPWARPEGRAQSDEAVDETDCRAQIPKVVCHVEGNQGSNFDRPCLTDSDKYFPAFERLYDRFPAPLQKMFCHMEKIFVEKDLDSTAYAMRGSAVIGIRASIIDEKLSLTDWSTWKEQLSFGGSLTSYKTRDDLPTYEGEQTEGEDNFLYSVIAHEFGHLLDFANNVNGFSVRPGSWTALSWQSISTPKKGNDYLHRSGMCFYSCSRALPRTAVPELYESLHKTNFLNTYTARNAYEDFADTFSFYLLFKNVRQTYVLNTKQGKTYDAREVLDSEALAPKKAWVERFFEKPDLKYPN